MRRAWLALLLIAGCGGEPSEPAETTTAPWVEVGQGETAFEALSDEDRIEIVHGPQGGWHVELASRFGGASPEGGVAVYRVWDPSHEEPISYPIKAALDDAIAQDDGSYEQAGMRTVFAIDGPEEIVGMSWLVEAELVVAGEAMVDERLVTLVDEQP